jgi:arylsulfatase A-like enzyme
VPAIMSWPGVIPQDQVVSEMVMTADILPTICHAAGVTPPQDRAIDGRDALPVAASRGKSPHGPLFWANGAQLAVRRGRWKLVMNGIVYGRTPDGQKPLPGDDALFLSDLEADPGETRNLRHQNPRLVDELSTLAQKWRQDVEQDQ